MLSQTSIQTFMKVHWVSVDAHVQVCTSASMHACGFPVDILVRMWIGSLQLVKVNAFKTASYF